MQLQRTVGNAATGRLLARAPAGALANRRHAGTAFVRGAGEHESGVDADDVAQGALNDCFFLAPLIAVAQMNPGRIRRMIRGPVETLPDGRQIFEVDLYARGATGKPQLRTFLVDDQFVSDRDGGLQYARYGDTGAAGPELWVMLFEKAFAMLKGGYDKAEWQSASEGLMALTGRESQFMKIVDFISDEMMLRIFSQSLRDGKPVIMLTKQTFDADGAGDEDMAPGQPRVRLGSDRRPRWKQHYYSVAAVDRGRQTLDLRDPYGRNHLRGFPIAEVRRFFHSYELSPASVR